MELPLGEWKLASVYQYNCIQSVPVLQKIFLQLTEEMLLQECFCNNHTSLIPASVLLSAVCRSYGPINPVPNSTWTFLKTLFNEVGNKVFADEYMHLGGDEVSYSCW